MATPKLSEAACKGTHLPNDDGSDENFVYGGPENADGELQECIITKSNDLSDFDFGGFLHRRCRRQPARGRCISHTRVHIPRHRDHPPHGERRPGRWVVHGNTNRLPGERFTPSTI